MAAKMTMRQQYLSIKKNYPDVILFFRLGDFYETFDDDAKLVAEVLDVTLTVRGLGGDQQTPMAGVPYHAVDTYLEQLVNKGYRVAICEQMDDMVHKTLQKREVVRVVTPGTLTDPTMLQPERNSYLAAIIADRGKIGLAYADLTTGEFCATELVGDDARKQLEGELVRLQAAEILVSDAPELRPAELEVATKQLEHDLAPMRKAERERLLPHERTARKVEGENTSAWAQGSVTIWANWRWEARTARDALLNQFGVQSLDGYGLQGKALAGRAAGALVQYLRETQRDAVAQIRGLRVYDTATFMFLDPQTRRNLELLEGASGQRKGSLISVLDQTRTPMGARMLRQWLAQPLLQLAPLQARQEAVARFAEATLIRNEIRAALKPLGDVERTVNRVVQGIATPRDVVRLRESLRALPALCELLAHDDLQSALSVLAPAEEHADDSADDLFDADDRDTAALTFDACDDLCELLEQAIADDPPALLGLWDNARADENVIRRGFAPEIDQIVEATRDATRWINELEAKEQARSGIKSLKVSYNRVFGYYIEISKATADARIPDDYIRKQTLVNAERYITPELKEYEALILNASEALNEHERTVFKRVCKQIAAQGHRMLATARRLAEVDVLTTLAEVAIRNRYVRPHLRDDSYFHIVGGRHPVVEQNLIEPFVPNDVEFAPQQCQIMVLTGPNMSGKCLAGDTLIFTDHGLLTLEALRPAPMPASGWAPLDCSVYGRTGRKQATHFYAGGTQPTIKLRTSLGFQLEGTAEHRIWVQDAAGGAGWKYFAELALGDKIALERNANLWGNQTDLRPYTAAIMEENNAAHLPARLTSDLAYLLGACSAAGPIHDGDWTLPAHNQVLAAHLRQIIAEQWGGTGDDQQITSMALRGWLRSLGLGEPQQRIPALIRCAPRPLVAAFLAGLFASADAHPHGTLRLELAEQAAREVQLLLLNMGVLAAIHPQPQAQHTTWTLRVDERETLRFQAIAAGASRPAQHQAAWAVASVQMQQAPHGALAPTQRQPIRDQPGASNCVDAALWAAAPQEAVYDQIVRLETGQAEVYDLSVAVDHSYVANGIVSHNSTYLRQVAVIALMAQIGSFVPADGAELGLLDRIFTRIGAQDDIATGQSTFMVEMIESANILQNATPRSLIILDEIGRGTSTYDGLSIARAVIEYIHNQPRLRAKTLFATHYHELTELASILPRVRNWTMAVAEEGDHVVFLRKIIEGGADRSYGIHVAQMAGMPPAVVKRATEVLAELEGRGSKEQRREAMRRANGTSPAQPSLFDAPASPAVDELRTMDVTQLTPIEALTKLYELQRMAKDA